MRKHANWKAIECDPCPYSCRSKAKGFSTWYTAIKGEGDTVLNINRDFEFKIGQYKHLKITAIYMTSSGVKDTDSCTVNWELPAPFDFHLL